MRLAASQDADDVGVPQLAQHERLYHQIILRHLLVWPLGGCLDYHALRSGGLEVRVDFGDDAAASAATAAAAAVVAFFGVGDVHARRNLAGQEALAHRTLSLFAFGEFISPAQVDKVRACVCVFVHQKGLEKGGGGAI